MRDSTGGTKDNVSYIKELRHPGILSALNQYLPKHARAELLRKGYPENGRGSSRSGIWF